MLLAATLVATGCSSEAGAASEWPGLKPTYIAVFVAPGGATDLSNRAIAAAIEREMGARFSVLNMPGAQGGVAAAYAWNAPRDGHVWFGTAEASLGMGVLGAHTTSARDWRYFLVGGTPGILSVPEGSPYRSVRDLIAAVRERPGQIRIASSIQGSAWHIQYLALARAGDLGFRWISYQGSHPSQLAALTGEVDVVLTGLGEQAEFLRGGRLRALAALQSEPLEVEGVGLVPPITDAVPELAAYLPLRQFVGFALPADTPPETLARVEEAFQRAMQSEEVLNFGRQSYSELLGLSGEDAQRLVQEQEKVFAWSLYDEGLGTISPERFGIERP
jgi:tripartite-type tricarboxylate transporter receptor subunit TctC